MKRSDLALAMLGLAEGHPYTPAQIQKALFLVTRNLPQVVSRGSGYDFQPYDYGPFDKSVYADLRDCARRGLATIEDSPGARWPEYRATSQGVAIARELVSGLPPNHAAYLKEVSDWVRSLTFSQLVSAIYKAYPETKVNSVFTG